MLDRFGNEAEPITVQQAIEFLNVYNRAPATVTLLLNTHEGSFSPHTNVFVERQNKSDLQNKIKEVLNGR